MRGSPLHDGAVIIKGDRLLAAACLLPLSANPNVQSDARHAPSRGDWSYRGERRGGDRGFRGGRHHFDRASRAVVPRTSIPRGCSTRLQDCPRRASMATPAKSPIPTASRRSPAIAPPSGRLHAGLWTHDLRAAAAIAVASRSAVDLRQCRPAYDEAQIDVPVPLLYRCRPPGL